MYARLLIALLTLALVIGVASAWHFTEWTKTPLGVTQATIITLAPGSSFNAFTDTLAHAGIVDAPLYLRLLAEWRNVTADLQAGEYQIEPGDTPESVLRKVVAGDTVTYIVRIPEGVTIATVLDQLLADNRLAGELPSKPDLIAQLAVDAPSLEGWLLPESYQIRRGDARLLVVQRAYDAMRRELARAWTSRCESTELKSPYELLIMASLVEKETGRPEDRDLVSQVFHLRLASNMRLQTDPTVIYALGQQFDGNLRKADLSIDSPFNTYKYRGLPPTPIALPSIAALQAAACPADTDYLYFVARGDGSSQFSRTLEEHNQAVRRYQLGGND